MGEVAAPGQLVGAEPSRVQFAGAELAKVLELEWPRLRCPRESGFENPGNPKIIARLLPPPCLDRERLAVAKAGVVDVE